MYHQIDGEDNTTNNIYANPSANKLRCGQKDYKFECRYEQLRVSVKVRLKEISR